MMYERDRKNQMHTRLLKGSNLNIMKEVRYIIDRAKKNDGRVISLGALTLFSTRSGDAWLLDSEDKLALCLASDGQEQPFEISETSTTFKIGWNSNYRIDGDFFIVIKETGQVKSIIGYPTDKILMLIEFGQSNKKEATVK